MMPVTNHQSPITSDRVPVLAIDGPSSSGKGTVGRRIAAHLGWHFLESGALYRALALAARRAGVPVGDAGRLAELARALNVRFEPNAEGGGVLLAGADVSAELVSEDIGHLASQVATVPAVRRALLGKQHAQRRPPGLVADGRDMGTVVFPDAILKIFLTASPEARAERRHKQLKDKGFDVNLARLAEEIRARDARDAERAASPLKPADDACIVDTSSLTVDEVVHRILALLRERHVE